MKRARAGGKGEARPGQHARADAVCCVCARVYNGCQKQPRKETSEFGINLTKGKYSAPLCAEFRQAAGLFVSVCRCLAL